jgi:transposase
MIGNPEDRHVPAVIRPILGPLVEQWRSAGEQIAELERQIIAWHKGNADSQLLETIPQFGHHRRGRALRERKAMFGMDRHRAQAELQRRPRVFGRHHQDRRPLFAPAAGGRRHRHDPPGARPSRGPSLVCRSARPHAAKEGRRRARQQSLPRRRPGMARIGWAVLRYQTRYRAPAPQAA